MNRIKSALRCLASLAAASTTLAFAGGGPITVEVIPALAPNVFGSPSWATWQTNALNAIENGLSSAGAAGPTQYNRQITPITHGQAVVTGYQSWMGVAPGPHAGELGNRMHFGVHVLGNGTKFSISQLSFSATSVGDGGGLDFAFTGYQYSAAYYGIDYVDGIKGNGNDIVITGGADTQLVDELVGRGSGNSYASYPSDPGATDQDRLDYVADHPDTQWSVFTATWTVGSTSGSGSFFSSGAQGGVPVDLTGRYMEPGNTGSSYTSNFAIASTASDPSNFGTSDVVMEESNGAAATDGTFSPFSDALKAPSSLTINPLGKSWTFDVALSGTWTDNGFGYPARSGSVFIVGAKMPGGFSSGIMDVVIDHPDSGGYRFDASTDLSDALVQDSTGASSFRITAAMTTGSAMLVTIETLNGSFPGTTYTLGPVGSNPVGAGAYFTAGFNRSYGGADKGQAVATVSNFTTNAIDNVVHNYAADPYAQTGDAISYSFGMSNLAQYVIGYQAFLSTSGNQTYLGGGYTSSPFGYHFLLFGTTSGGYLALDGQTGGPFGPFPEAGGNAALATVNMTAGAAGTASLGVNVDNGNPLTPTRFADPGGSPVVPLRRASNTVVIDNTGPSVTINTPASPVMQGNLVFTVTANDGSASGLTANPTILVTFDDLSTQLLQTYAKTANTFEAVLPITATTECGTTTAAATAVDDSGNSTTTVSGPFTINPEQITLSLSLSSVSATFTRGVKFVVGGAPGNLGGNAPLVVSKNVSFVSGSATVVLNATDGLVCGAAYTHISAKDELHTLRKVTTLAGTSGAYTASLALKSGDVNNDNAIDILHFGIFASQYGSSVAVNTPVGTLPYHSDFTGDGVVATADYTFISTQFLNVGDNVPGTYDPAPRPRSRCTVKEMEAAGVPKARAMDLNRDGILTYQEIEYWMFHH